MCMMDFENVITSSLSFTWYSIGSFGIYGGNQHRETTHGHLLGRRQDG